MWEIKTVKDDVYVVYYYKGELKVARGCMTNVGTIRRYDRDYYHTGLADKPLTLRNGSVWVWDKEDIPAAIEIVKNRRRQYYQEQKTRYEQMFGKEVTK